MTSKEFIERLSRETVSAQEAFHNQLAKFRDVGGPRLEDIRIEELAYLALSLIVYAIFRWSRKYPKAEIADGVSLNVLRRSRAGRPLSDLIRQYQERSAAYKNALPALSDDAAWKRNEFELALLLSRSIVGKESPALGLVICSTLPIVLTAMQNLIKELEHS